jgi:hypothetical protein
MNMESPTNSILLIGESDVGKTHYGAQLLKRLMKGDGALRMNGAASNLQPFESTLERLNEGMAAKHTTAGTYLESVWPIVDEQGRAAELIWPDYGGEQVHSIIANRQVPAAWRDRTMNTPAWLLLMRLQKIRSSEDIFSRPISDLVDTRNESRELEVSDQARMIELMQMLTYAAGLGNDRPLRAPRLMVLLTCWDEMPAALEPDNPQDVLRRRLPMFCEFLFSTWERVRVFGLSALEKPLSKTDRDSDFAESGPEKFGYVVLPDGARSTDLTLPIRTLIADAA